MPSLRSIRIKRLLTQEELAARSGVPQQTIARIERSGKHRPALRTIRKLSQALGVEATEIDEFRASLEGE